MGFWLATLACHSSFIHLCTDSFHSHTDKSKKNGNDNDKNCLGRDFFSLTFLMFRMENINEFSKSLLIHVLLIPHIRLRKQVGEGYHPHDCRVT